MNYSKIWSQFAHWVFFNLLKENSELNQFFNKLSKNPLGKWLGTLWANPEKKSWKNLRVFWKNYLLGKVKSNPKNRPVSKFWSKWWAIFEIDQKKLFTLPSGYFFQKTLRFFHDFFSKFAHNVPNHLLNGFFESLLKNWTELRVFFE